MLGKIESRKGCQRMSWLDGITDAMDVNLGKLWEMVRDREAWHVALQGLQSRTWLVAWTTYVSYILIKLGEGKNKVQLFSKPFQGIQDKFFYPSLVSSSTLTPQRSHVLSSKNASFSSLCSFAHLVTLLMLSSPSPQLLTLVTFSETHPVRSSCGCAQSALSPALCCDACPPRLSPVQFFSARGSVLFTCPIRSIKIC